MPRAAVIGAAGYGGAVAAAILHRHPEIELTALTARNDAGRRHDELYPAHRVPLEMEVFDPDLIAERADAAVIAYPHKAAAEAVSKLRRRGLKVVDLSADFRLEQAAYERWYQPHEAPELLAESVPACPRRTATRSARRSSWRGRAATRPPRCSPCCPPRPDRGRGRGHQGGCLGSRPRGHGGDALRLGRRQPERLQDRRPPPQRRDGAGAAGRALLVPDPPDAGRPGIFASCYATLEEPLAREEVRALYEERYADEPFIDLTAGSPRTQNVRNTNRAQVHVTVVGERVIALAAIDNLWKGAAGQGVQDLNLMLGLPETAGLE